jgi:hypothetical protein
LRAAETSASDISSFEVSKSISWVHSIPSLPVKSVTDILFED